MSGDLVSRAAAVEAFKAHTQARCPHCGTVEYVGTDDWLWESEGGEAHDLWCGACQKTYYVVVEVERVIVSPARKGAADE